MTQTYLQSARRFASLIASVAGLTLVLRVVLKFQETGSVLGSVSYLSQFFTILTNTLVFGLAIAVLLGVAVSPRVTKAVTIAIVGVGLVYHAVLAHLLDLSGLALLADHGVHTFVPILMLTWWLFFLPKATLKGSDLAGWIVWPLAYCGYILIRASFSGFYPYPFLNLPELGWAGLIQSIAMLCVAFVVIGLVLTAIARLIGREFPKTSSSP